MNIYKECLEIAEELIWEDYIKSEFPLWKRDRYDMEDVRENMLSEYSDLQKIELGEDFLKLEIKQNNYKYERQKLIDLEWLETFQEWKQLYGSSNS